jgi:hypothetical protein
VLALLGFLERVRVRRKGLNRGRWVGGWPASSLGFSWYTRRIVSSKSGCLLVAKLYANSPEESPSVGVGPALPSLSRSL